MKRCKKCGKIHNDSHNFCGECGSNIESNFTYICNHCGRIYSDGSVECPKCHAKPDILLPPDVDTANSIEIQETATQKVGELKEKVAATTATAGAASSFLKTASEKASEVGKKVAGQATNISHPETDSTNQVRRSKYKLIALIVFVILIFGLGGYLALGSSSNDKETAARPATGQISKASISNSDQKAKPVAKPAPPPPPTVKQDTARNAFIGFHTAITNRQLADAYNILSPDYQRFVRGYDNFARGYTTTLRSDVVELNTIKEDNNFAILTYKLKAEDQVDGGKATQYFVGKAKLVKLDGQWRIDSTEAKKASQNSSLPTNTVNSTVSKAKTVGTITGNDVNVRKGPGVDYKSLGVFFKGDKVRIINSSRNSLNETWYKIEFDNPTAGLIVGWVRSDFININ